MLFLTSDVISFNPRDGRVTSVSSHARPMAGDTFDESQPRDDDGQWTDGGGGGGSERQADKSGKGREPKGKKTPAVKAAEKAQAAAKKEATKRREAADKKRENATALAEQAEDAEREAEDAEAAFDEAESDVEGADAAARAAREDEKEAEGEAREARARVEALRQDPDADPDELNEAVEESAKADEVLAETKREREDAERDAKAKREQVPVAKKAAAVARRDADKAAARAEKAADEAEEAETEATSAQEEAQQALDDTIEAEHDEMPVEERADSSAAMANETRAAADEARAETDKANDALAVASEQHTATLQAIDEQHARDMAEADDYLYERREAPEGVDADDYAARLAREADARKRDAERAANREYARIERAVTSIEEDEVNAEDRAERWEKFADDAEQDRLDDAADLALERDDGDPRERLASAQDAFQRASSNVNAAANASTRAREAQQKNRRSVSDGMFASHRELTMAIENRDTRKVKDALERMRQIRSSDRKAARDVHTAERAERNARRELLRADAAVKHWQDAIDRDGDGRTGDEELLDDEDV